MAVKAARPCICKYTSLYLLIQNRLQQVPQVQLTMNINSDNNGGEFSTPLSVSGF